MTSKPLHMNRADISNFTSNNQDAIHTLDIACDDYVAGRLCLLHGFFSGLSLIAQSIEKYLKAYLYLSRHPKVRQYGHKIVKLSEEVDRLHGTSLITNYKSLLERINNHYNDRYHDNPNSVSFKSSDEIKDYDNIIYYLVENIPLPDEVKFRSGIYVRICFSSEDRLDGINRISYQEYWLLENNEPFRNNLDTIFQRYIEVRNHLYPK